VKNCIERRNRDGRITSEAVLIPRRTERNMVKNL